MVLCAWYHKKCCGALPASVEGAVGLLSGNKLLLLLLLKLLLLLLKLLLLILPLLLLLILLLLLLVLLPLLFILLLQLLLLMVKLLLKLLLLRLLIVLLLLLLLLLDHCKKRNIVKFPVVHSELELKLTKCLWNQFPVLKKIITAYDNVFLNKVYFLPYKSFNLT